MIVCSVDGVNGVASVRSGAEVSFLDDCPTTTWAPLGPVKTEPAGPFWGADALATAELGVGGFQVQAPGSVVFVPPGAAAASEPTTATARISEATNSIRDGRQRRLPEADCLSLRMYFPPRCCVFWVAPGVQRGPYSPGLLPRFLPLAFEGPFEDVSSSSLSAASGATALRFLVSRFPRGCRLRFLNG